MSYKFFNATKRLLDKPIHNQFDGDGLLAWLERYVKAVFPKNGIDYWTNGRNSDDETSKPLPSVHAVDGYRNAACYVYAGGEGQMIQVGLMLKTGQVQSVGRAKSFGDADQNWEIARAMSEAVESMYLYSEMPEVVDIVERLPVKSAYEEYHGELWIGFDHDRLTVYEPFSGRNLAHYDYSDSGNPNAGWYAIEPYLKDWCSTLNRFDIRHVVMATNELHDRIASEASHKELIKGIHGDTDAEQSRISF